MKILVFNWQDITNPLAGGAEVHLHEVFERLAARGHEVTLFCHAYPGSLPEEIRSGIRIVRKGGRFLFNFLVPRMYRSRFRKEGYDVVVDDVNKIPFFTPLFVREPVQGVTHHLFGKSIFRETNFPVALYVFLLEKLIKPVYRNVHFIIGSPSTYQEYRKWGFPEHRVTIVNYCVNRNTYYPAKPHSPVDRLRIAYFGRLKRYKSVEHLLQAAAVLIGEFPQLNVDIIGDGDDRPRLEKISHELGLVDILRFHGFILEEEKAPLLQKTNVVINTSSKEGWGLTVVEANACGVPVIAADVPGLRDSVVNGQTGLLYPYGNIDALVSAIRSLLADPQQRDRLAEGALQWADRFDWEHAADETLVCLERTVAAGNSRIPSSPD